MHQTFNGRDNRPGLIPIFLLEKEIRLIQGGRGTKKKEQKLVFQQKRVDSARVEHFVCQGASRGCLITPEHGMQGKSDMVWGRHERHASRTRNVN